MQISTPAIGDLNSTAKGSGARALNGKPDLSLIPLRILARTFTAKQTALALTALGQFQETQNTAYLIACLENLGPGWHIDCAHVFSYGKRKYAAWNWLKGMPWSVPLACAARHLVEMLEGKTTDEDQVIDGVIVPGSHLPLRGHVACNVVMLLQYAESYGEGNDLAPVEMFGNSDISIVKAAA